MSSKTAVERLEAEEVYLERGLEHGEALNTLVFSEEKSGFLE